MYYFSYLLMTLLMFSGLFLIGLILLQRGRGGGLAGAFGGMGGQSAFGTKAGDVFTRITIGVASAWILLCAGSVVALHQSSAGRADASLFKPDDAANVKKADPKGDEKWEDGAVKAQKADDLPAPAAPDKGDVKKEEATKAEEKKPEAAAEKPAEQKPADAAPAAAEVKSEEAKPTEAAPTEKKPEAEKPTDSKPEAPAEKKPE